MEYKNHYENKIFTRENKNNGPDSDAKRVLSRYDVARPPVPNGEDSLRTAKCSCKYVIKQSVADRLQEAVLQNGCMARGKSHSTTINQHVTECDI